MLAVSISILTACVTTPTGRSALRLHSEEFMASMGQASFERIKARKTIETSYAVNSYVRCVSNRLIRVIPPEFKLNDPVRWEIRVFKDKEPNAFALPGNKIGVQTGMLNVAKNADQLAAVIGHEIAHVLIQHGNERLSQTQLTFVGLTAAGVLSDSENTQLILAALGVGLQVGVLLPFSRLHESEADSLGLMLSASAGFDPQGAVALWRNMQAQSKGSPPTFLSTHPANSARIRALQALQTQVQPLYNNARKQNFSPCIIA